MRMANKVPAHYPYCISPTWVDVLDNAQCAEASATAHIHNLRGEQTRAGPVHVSLPTQESMAGLLPHQTLLGCSWGHLLALHAELKPPEAGPVRSNSSSRTP